MSEKIIAYKAMDKKMQCRGKQYEVGKTYHEDKADCCNEVNFAGLVKATVNAVFNRVKGKEPFSSGYSSTAGSSGNYSTAAATGAYCRAKANGKDNVAVANGAHSKARGVLGCYLVLTEYDNDGNMLWAKMAKVDGAHIKENVWYTLKNGEFAEVDP